MEKNRNPDNRRDDQNRTPGNQGQPNQNQGTFENMDDIDQGQVGGQGNLGDKHRTQQGQQGQAQRNVGQTGLRQDQGGGAGGGTPGRDIDR